MQQKPLKLFGYSKNQTVNTAWLLFLVSLLNNPSSLFAATPDVPVNQSAPELESSVAESETKEVVQAKNTFNIFEFKVEGNTILPIGKIEEAVYSQLGENKTIDDVEVARTKLEKTYHEAGYLTVLVSIPEQEVDEGIVKLAVTESTVEQLRISGARYFTLGKIRAGVPEMTEGKTPHFPTLQKQLAALNRSGDRRVTPVMKAGKTPGTLAVELKVDDKLPLHGAIGLNDRFSPDTTRWRSSFNVHYDNLWQLQHSINFTWLSAPQAPNESTVFAGTYSMPLESGDYLALYAVHSESDIAAINTLNVLGQGDIVGLRYIRPLPALENFTHTLTAGVDYKNFKQTLNLISGSGFNTPISYLPVLLNWDGELTTKSATTKLGLSLNSHFRDVVGSEDEFADKRFKAHSSYIYMRANIDQSYRFENEFRVSVRVTGQITDQPLISNEQFAIGGAETVRGYLESEVLGDKGYVANLEIHTPSFARHISPKVTDLHALIFADFGEAFTNNPLPSQRESASLASYGVGFRLNLLGANAVLDYAKTLKNGSDNNTQDGDSRWHVGLEYAF